METMSFIFLKYLHRQDEMDLIYYEDENSNSRPHSLEQGSWAEQE